jgi:hypothetical protein
MIAEDLGRKNSRGNDAAGIIAGSADRKGGWKVIDDDVASGGICNGVASKFRANGEEVPRGP